MRTLFTVRSAPALLVALLITLTAARPGDAQTVSASLSSDGRTVHVLSVTLQPPAPGSLIAAMRLPADARIVSAAPSPARIDHGSGSVKWLLKNPPVGTVRLRVTTDAPVAPAALSASLSYRRPDTGQLVTVPAARR